MAWPLAVAEYVCDADRAPFSRGPIAGSYPAMMSTCCSPGMFSPAEELASSDPPEEAPPGEAAKSTSTSSSHSWLLGPPTGRLATRTTSVLTLMRTWGLPSTSMTRSMPLSVASRSRLGSSSVMNLRRLEREFVPIWAKSPPSRPASASRASSRPVMPVTTWLGSERVRRASSTQTSLRGGWSV